MIQWILIVVLYLLGAGLFRLLGGFSSAGEAFRQWGHSQASSRAASGSSS
jgi:hypothetical protein